MQSVYSTVPAGWVEKLGFNQKILGALGEYLFMSNTIYIYTFKKNQNSVTLGLWIYFHPAKSIDMNQ